jgi:hypothetical protein
MKKRLQFMRIYSSTKAVLACLMLISNRGYAEAPRNVLDVMRDKSVTQEDLAAVIINRDVGTEWIIPALNAPSFDDQTTTQSPTTLFARNAAQAMYGTLSKMPVDSLSASDYDAFHAVIDFRDELLDAGGSGNACLAGSATYAIHARLLHDLLHNENADVNIISYLANKNRVSIKRVVNALTKDGRWTSALQSYDINSEDAAALQSFLNLTSQSSGSKAGEPWMLYFKEKKLACFCFLIRIFYLLKIHPHNCIYGQSCETIRFASMF